MTNLPKYLISVLLLAAAAVEGFQLQTRRPLRSTIRLHEGAADNPDLIVVKNFLEENYPSMYALLQKNDGVWKALGGSMEGFTVFAVSQSAFSSLDQSKREQLGDERNFEQAEKIGAYHVIAEVVTAEQLFDSGGIITLGGEVPVGRSVTGGMFGFGGKEDGGITVSGSKVIQTTAVGNGLCHEVDDFISPSLLWRYMDQLRIPGSN